MYVTLHALLAHVLGNPKDARCPKETQPTAPRVRVTSQAEAHPTREEGLP